LLSFMSTNKKYQILKSLAVNKPCEECGRQTNKL
jgi:hypothetical protein